MAPFNSFETVPQANADFEQDKAPSSVLLSEIISALSYALDLTEGQPMGHSVRSCVFGMHIAREIGLSQEAHGDLYYALLMKDAGCSTNASRMFQILGTDDDHEGRMNRELVSSVITVFIVALY